MNSFGQIYRVTTFGESHGPAIGGVIDGMPAGLEVDFEAVDRAMERRRPGASATVSSRREPDRVEFLSGIYDGFTSGTPIGFIIRNHDQRPADYNAIAQGFRPSHADFSYQMKYGNFRDPRGGGRSSARETACRVVAGELARQVLNLHGISIDAKILSVGDTLISSPEQIDEIIGRVKAEGDTIGGVIECTVAGAPAGLGEPVYGKLSSRLAEAMVSINAVKGIEFGMGFEGCRHLGSEVADRFVSNADGKIQTSTNYSGGIQGGISNGMPIVMRIAFKPAPTLMRDIETVNSAGESITIPARGRHDACVLPRAVPVVEAMAACVMLDALLLNRLTLL